MFLEQHRSNGSDLVLNRVASVADGEACSTKAAAVEFENKQTLNRRGCKGSTRNAVVLRGAHLQSRAKREMDFRSFARWEAGCESSNAAAHLHKPRSPVTTSVPATRSEQVDQPRPVIRGPWIRKSCLATAGGTILGRMPE